MRTKAEFENLYRSILYSIDHLTHLTERERSNFKIKFLETFQKYSSVRLTDEHEAVLNRLHKRDDIVILRQDKGRGVVIVDKTTYISKAEDFLGGQEFIELQDDPTKSFQTKVQDTLREMKKSFGPATTYDKIYPSSARPGRYYGLAKLHKIANRLDEAGIVDELPMRPVISNIGTATYELSRYLAGILKPLTRSDFSVDSSKEFVDTLKTQTLPPGFCLVSFDVVSLFTKVPLDFTIELILKKIYEDRVIATKISRHQMKKLLLMCTKEMHFSFNGRIYQQVDGVAMGSPLGPVIANVFMAELEQTIVPNLAQDIKFWRRYVDDTFAFVKQDRIQAVLDCLNSYHPSIQFTHEMEEDGRIAFLDVKVITREDRGFETDIHRKKTDTNLYINWCAFAPKAWKIGTLKGLVRRAFVLCSTVEARNREISFLKKVFRGVNRYPSRVVTSTILEVERKFQQDTTEASESESDVDQQGTDGPLEAQDPVIVSKPIINLPYKGKDGEQIIRKFKAALNHALPETVKPQVVYTGKKISTFFQVKDPVPLEHDSNLVYRFVRHDVKRYVGETKVRNGERENQHRHTDKASAIFKFLRQPPEEDEPNDGEFKILEKGLPNKVTRKLAEALYIKEYNPDLNVNKQSYKLVLFN